MSDGTPLERRYRRLLACYPRTFRREHEQEILGVLMAGASDGQQRPRLAETADLITNAVWMHLHRGVPRSRPTVFWAVRLIYVCAGLRLLGIPILPAHSGGTAYPLDIGMSWGVLAVLAWANGRGHNWARVLFAVWVGLHTLALFYDVAHASALSASPWSIIASIVFWVVECSAVVLILSRQSRPYYRHKPAHPLSG
jgi:hypothetical protein